MTGYAFRPPRIAVGVDGSDSAAAAADWAADLAEDLGAGLSVVHAAERPRTEAATLLARTAARLTGRHPALRVETELADRDPIRALTAASLDASLLVTGTRRRAGLTGMLLGSVSNSVAAHAHCPVVVVATGPDPHPRPEIVLGLEPDEAAEPIEFTFRVAARLGLALRVVRVLDFPWQQNDLGMESLLKLARDEYPQVEVTLESRVGVTVPVLASAARGARLLVVGSRRERRLRSYGPGHVVHGLLAAAATPVAVVLID